jgi:hypothetical protein
MTPKAKIWSIRVAILNEPFTKLSHFVSYWIQQIIPLIQMKLTEVSVEYLTVTWAHLKKKDLIARIFR